jgi:hypothetical protein
MLPKRPLIYKSALIICAALCVSGCALFGEKKAPAVLKREKVFNAPYEDVERAIKQSMIKYPAKVDNPDAGIYETDWVKDVTRFRPAQMRDDFPDGFQYRLLVRMAKGRTTKSATKVIISKEAVLNRDFFAEPEPVPSDGTEEDVILYRVGRELAIERAIKKFQEKQNKSSASSQ